MSLPQFEEPSFSYKNLKRIKLGDTDLQNYQNKLIELRDTYNKQLDKFENCFFYQGKGSTTETLEPPANNVFASFQFLPEKLSDKPYSDWIIYWNPNLEKTNDKNLNWDSLGN